MKARPHVAALLVLVLIPAAEAEATRGDRGHEAQARAVGRWQPPFRIARNHRGYAMHAALLRTGKVLFYGYPAHEDHPWFRHYGNRTYAWLWDPRQGTDILAFKDVTVRDRDGSIVPIDCSGMSFLPDGRLLAVGGNERWPDESADDGYIDHGGLNRAFLFDPVAERWTEIPRPPGSDGRYYPSQALLPNGRTLVMAGLSEEEPGGLDNLDLEIYRRPSAAHPAGRFRLLTGSAQRRNTELYPHLFVLPDGQVAVAGPGQDDFARFDPQSLHSPWTDLGRQTVRIGGNAVLLPRGPAGSYEVLQLAGRPNLITRAVSTTERADFRAADPVWRPGPRLHVRRSDPNTVLLPDRSLVVIGGGVDEKAADPVRARRVELLHRGENTFRLGAEQTEDRGYHSTALLLPDGRVLSAGDDQYPTSDGTRAGSLPFDTAEIYRPPYLFKGPRPKITDAPRAIDYSERFAVRTKSGVSSALLAAPSAVTHGADMTQRIVPLRVARGRGARRARLTGPAGPALAPPGWYMLFVVKDGVPSIGSWVRLRR